MGLMQKACETYDSFANLAGVYEEGKAVLTPISHASANATVEITVDQNGTFVTARKVPNDEPKTVFPVSEESAGRTSTSIRPHPLCDHIGYLLRSNPEKYNAYVSNLEEWANSRYSSPKLYPILSYVKNGTLYQDLIKAGIAKADALDDPGKHSKYFVRWIIVGIGNNSGPCWQDKELLRAYTQYYAEKIKNRKNALCMVSGEMTIMAEQHLKGIVSKHGNAKLISSQDKQWFTYLGRMTDANQALTIGYLTSQKAHNALKWLVENQGVAYGKRMFLCWNPKGFSVPSFKTPFARKVNAAAKNPTDYKKKLQDALNGWKTELPSDAEVVYAAFDAATTGRLSLAYYNEFRAEDFLQRLHDWDLSCCWENGRFGIESPSLRQIVDHAFGTYRERRFQTDDAIMGQHMHGTDRERRFQTDDAIMGQHMQRLVACRLSGARMPRDILNNLVTKCAHLVNYDTDDKDYSKDQRAEMLFTACAVIKKYQSDYFGREWQMSLDKNCKDRSYLFGRLLAIAEVVESSTYKREEERETNAIRLQAAFSMRPLSTWRVLEERLKPYYSRLKPGSRIYFQNMVQEIVSTLEYDDPKLNSKLDDIYLLGYYHQKAYKNEQREDVTSSED